MVYYKIVVLFILNFSLLTSVHNLVVGSNTSVSRQGKIVFPAADSDNEMRGFALFEGGILFQSPETLTVYNALFPMSKGISLNGGTLNLSKNLDFENEFSIVTAGCIDGNFNTVTFSEVLSDLQIPISSSKFFKQLDLQSYGDDVFSVDWNADGTYLAAGLDGNGGEQELKILYFDGSLLTTTLSLEVSTDVKSVRWHPKLNYFAYAKNNGGSLVNEISIRLFNISNGTLLETGGVNTARSSRAIAWHPSGNYLLTGEQGNSSTDEIRMYTFDSGVGSITTLDSINLSPDRHVALNALSFAPGGNYFVVGSHRVSSSPTLLVYGFNGSTISLDVEESIGSGVFGVDWHPTGTYIAVGLQGGSERLRIYKHDAVLSTLTEATSARVGERIRVNSVHWDSTGNYLATGTRSGSNSKLNIYLFDKDNETLTEIKEFAYGNEVNDVRWSRDDCFIATGDDINDVTVYSTKNDVMLFKDVTLSFQSDVIVNDKWKFTGSCCIDMNGHCLILDDTSSLVVASQATLGISRTRIVGLQEGNIRCLDHTGTITLNNVALILSDNFTFSSGSLHIENDVIISGSSQFVYSSPLTSSIMSHARLLLDEGLFFIYSPIVDNQHLFDMVDGTSFLELNNCSLLCAATGIRFLRGTLLMDNLVTFSSYSADFNATFELSDNLNVILNAGAILNLFGDLQFF